MENLKDTVQITYPVMEAFYTIQGEGKYQGHAAYFIRLAGCDVGCVWCDVKESWEEEGHPILSVDEIVNEAKKYPGRLAVITGGEPCMHDLSPLTTALKEAGFHINIETSGAHELSGHIDWVCFSPKKFKAPLDEFYQKADELKVVIFHKSDFAWAEEHASKLGDDCLLYLQPEWGKSAKILPMIVDYVKDNPKWKISLQVHKYMDIP
ncbi:7-carboxy-7-deazaguanine synthase QueE [Sediminitomix flava]|uniref:7-carboxy-7-deazaguanine synthase n=1 Tax=Sediminitomix flava TaxID=379075 RepID=A0A315ZC29_SEDFL|nr:7-carboxy-7-deazaguanine synthase QueE [Sediminitomix flava]PWJ42358.1 organic radical activating enzyme [Sediminitomix flava]